jgi:hypothetical protein
VFVDCAFLHVDVTESQLFEQDTVCCLNGQFVDLLDGHYALALTDVSHCFVDELESFLNFGGQ